MARNPRQDTPGSWHHVMNRGVAKRTLFEGEHDVRFFLSRLAWAVRRGQLEVHAWCLLTTHFHLLVRSMVGELSAAMRRIQNDYSRRFNRARRRDGPLVRGRFASKPVSSVEYRRVLVRYIDANAVRAGLVSRPAEYAHGSARWFLRRDGRRWHTRGWIEDEVCKSADLETYDPRAYERAFPCDHQREVAYVVERRLSPKPLLPGRDLFAVAPPDVRAWMVRKARMADGTRPGLAVAAPSFVRTAVESVADRHGPWCLRPGSRSRDAWLLLRIGLLRDLSASSWHEIGREVGRSPSNAATLCPLHRCLLAEGGEYADRASEAAEWAMRILR